jgi:hypothetical protein
LLLVLNLERRLLRLELAQIFREPLCHGKVAMLGLLHSLFATQPNVLKPLVYKRVGTVKDHTSYPLDHVAAAVSMITGQESVRTAGRRTRL